MEGDLVVNSRVTIRRDELTFRFSRSSGPGGQNVNKLETRVEILFDLAHSPSLGDPDRELARARLAGYLDAEGVVHVTVSDTRSQLQNRALSVLRLQELLRRALRVRRARRPSSPPPGAVQARLDAKKQRGRIKKLRRPEADQNGGS